MPEAIRFGDVGADGEVERLHLRHPIVRSILNSLTASPPGPWFALRLGYSAVGRRIGRLEPYVGARGIWLACRQRLEGLGMEEDLVQVVLVGSRGGYRPVDAEALPWLFDLGATAEETADPGVDLDGPAVRRFVDEAAEGFFRAAEERNEGRRRVELARIEEYTLDLLALGESQLARLRRRMADALAAQRAAASAAEADSRRAEYERLETEYRRRLNRHYADALGQMDERARLARDLDLRAKPRRSTELVARATWVID
jgi:hypothetical protein